MRKFLISNPKYQGTIELVYDSAKLYSISFAGAVIDPEVMNAFKKVVPVTLGAFLGGTWATGATQVVEADFDLPFETFWNEYGNKVNRKRAEALWLKLNKTERLAAWQGVKKYKAYLNGLDWKRNPADPDTYLRNKYWIDYEK